MARTAKKETALTPEEKLVQALVPEAEQPYQVPENWCWTRLVYLITTSKEKTEDFSDPSVKYVGLENMEKNAGIVSYGAANGIKSLKNVFSKGQILYGKLRPYLNKHDVAPFDGVCSTDILVFDVRGTAINKYVNYFFNQQSFIEYTVSNSKGINLPRVSESVVLDSLCPLPPLAEQGRIVDRIESLFAKLDEAKEKAQTVVDSFEDRKAAILHKAFTGEMTKKWRECHNQELQSWVSTILKDCSSDIGDGLHGTPVYDDNGQYWFINGNNLSGSRIEFKADTKKVGFDEYMKYMVELSRETTVLLSINGTLGKTAFYDGEPIILGKSACYINTNDRLDKRFLRYYFISKEFIDYANSMATGSTIKNLGLKAMRNMPVSLPSIDEQNEIVRILDGVFEAEQQAKETAEQVIDQIDTMKKAILARAFRGELGTNDPSDESAIELLKKALQ